LLDGVTTQKVKIYIKKSEKRAPCNGALLASYLIHLYSVKRPPDIFLILFSFNKVFNERSLEYQGLQSVK
jgi:hypothetical protein